MNALYLSDRYVWPSWSVKRSLYATLAAQPGVEIEWCDYQRTNPEGKFSARMRRIGRGSLFDRAQANDYTHIFFASSGLSFERSLMKRLKAAGRILIGFGFSDPRFVEHAEGHWDLFDAFFTNSIGTCEYAQALGVKSHVMWPSIHPGFHDQAKASGEFDVVFMGDLVAHPQARERRKALNCLENEGVKILKIGRGGDTGHLHGVALLQALARGRIGLNMMGPKSALPHRLWEYAAVGLCIVTDLTPDIEAAFETGTETLPISALPRVLKDRKLCAQVGAAGRARCLRDHTMQRRVENILRVLRS